MIVEKLKIKLKNIIMQGIKRITLEGVINYVAIFTIFSDGIVYTFPYFYQFGKSVKQLLDVGNKVVYCKGILRIKTLWFYMIGSIIL